jgi:hypothetical protein
MPKQPREATNKILDMVDQGMLNERDLIRNLLCYLSEDEAQDFGERYGLFEDEEDEEENDEDEEDFDDED